MASYGGLEEENENTLLEGHILILKVFLYMRHQRARIF